MGFPSWQKIMSFDFRYLKLRANNQAVSLQEKSFLSSKFRPNPWDYRDLHTVDRLRLDRGTTMAAVKCCQCVSFSGSTGRCVARPGYSYGFDTLPKPDKVKTSGAIHYIIISRLQSCSHNHDYKPFSIICSIFKLKIQHHALARGKKTPDLNETNRMVIVFSLIAK